MIAVKTSVARAASKVLNASVEEIHQLLEYPPDASLGDLALPCFRFAKVLRQSPQSIAELVAAALKEMPEVESAEVKGGYVNLRLRRVQIAEEVVRTAATSVETLFSRKRLQGECAAIDYSSPNIAKPFGVGHLRSTMIGQSIARLLALDGCTVIRVNHLGDWGTQFGKNIVAYLKWGDEETVRQDPVRELFRLYVRFHEAALSDPSLEDEARLWFKKLEDGDEEAMRLWQWFISESLRAFRETYALLGVEFDHFLGESFYNDKMQAVVEELSARGLLVESDGAQVVDLSEWNMPPCIIRKSDGATIYATRDLAAALYRHDHFFANRLIYVVGAEQTLHFQQVFKVLELMDRPWASLCSHVAFGMMKYNGERLSTRRGKVVYLEDVLKRAIDEAKAIIEAKNPLLPNKERVAREVGIGAVVFNDLRTYRMHDVDFRYEDVLNFDGETGPYVQYTHARACAVLRKAEAEGVQPGDEWETATDAEWNLVKELAGFCEAFERAVDELDPSLIARALLDTCQAFNRFYHDDPILTAPDRVRAHRVQLTAATRNALAKGLYLLGLEAPQAM